MVLLNPHHVICNELWFVQKEFPLIDRNQLRRSVQESSPLTEAILQHSILMGFKHPSMGSYNGTIDPYEHINHYRTTMHN